jgi:thioredoxin 1
MRFRRFTTSLAASKSWIVAACVFSGTVLGWGVWQSEFCCRAEEVPGAISWVNDLNTAQRQASASGKLILVHFWSSTCPPCRFMTERVFPNRQVIQIISQDFVAVKVNVEQNPQLAKQFGVSAVPTCFILTPAGEVLQKWVGASEPTRYAQQLSEVRAKWKTQLAQQAGPPAFAGINPATPPAGIHAPSNGGTIPPSHVPTQPSLSPQLGALSSGSIPTQPQRTDLPPGPPPVRSSQNSWGNQFSTSGAPAPPTNPSLGPPVGPHGVAHAPSGGVPTASPHPMAGVFGGPSNLPPATGTPSPGDSVRSNNLQHGPQSRTWFAGMGPEIPGQSSPTASIPNQEIDSPQNPPEALTLATASSQPPAAGPKAGALTSEAPMQGYQGSASSPSLAGTDVTTGQPPAPWSQAPPAGNPKATFDRRGPLVGETAAASPGNPPLGLEGFCPVQLTDFGRWVPGNPQWGIIHEGRTYLFAGPTERAKFAADPDRYAPVLSGYDVVIAAEKGVLVPGKREFGGWYRGRVYLFASEQTLRQFDQDPNRYLSKLSQQGVQADRSLGTSASFPPGGFLTPAVPPRPDTHSPQPNPAEGSPSVSLWGYPPDRW